ncbi:PREDICTED: transcription factor bHLH18-like [Nicotiana attenuata]|uniref:Transcription factor bhlh18 n=1 Tax=Nicotiana attenuata TaxID=49451 RepID=A0A314KYV8_NICAT|nr:PREDICTED: transcription factor bHLH18-like [Nicotiana attenuata]XP_019267489.1 PREDICTED: transcription factor bHLH18-like [Nicotiana attenuata]OIT34345.1 transcription factor bhlh18 [Nicotiana attenuata]
MDFSSAKWWAEMETMSTDDHAYINHCQMMTQLDELPFNKPFSYDIQPCHAAAGILDVKPPFCGGYATETHQMTAFSPPPLNSSSVLSSCKFNSPSANTELPSGTTLNFSSSSVLSMDSDDFGDSQNLMQALGFGTADITVQKKSYNRTSLQAQDHVVAERKRRERLTQRFIALSTLIPNLKKLDKATVLGDAIKHIKQLEEQVKTLEEKAKKRNSKEAVVAVKRPRLASSTSDRYSSSSEDNVSSVSTDRSQPDIKVRASDGNNILISISCKKQTGIIKEIFSQVEKLKLSIISSSVMPFAHTTTHITIIAQMDHKLGMTAKNDANRIHAAIMKLIGGQEEEAPFTS